MTEATGSRTGRIVLGQNNYGKSEIRLVKVERRAERHELWDLDVSVALERDFEAAHTKGDNSRLLATDTMRNTVYALAKDHLTGSIEGFGLALVDHFLEAGPTVTSCWVGITQHRWDRIEVDGRPHEHSFIRGRGEREAEVSGDESGGRGEEQDDGAERFSGDEGREEVAHERPAHVRRRYIVATRRAIRAASTTRRARTPRRSSRGARRSR